MGSLSWCSRGTCSLPAQWRAVPLQTDRQVPTIEHDVGRWVSKPMALLSRGDPEQLDAYIACSFGVDIGGIIHVSLSWIVL